MSDQVIVLRDMKPETLTIEASRRSRLTRAELEAESGIRTLPACLCSPGEACWCSLTHPDADDEPERTDPS